MTEKAPNTGEESGDYLLDFMATHRVIRADNWPEYEAQGFAWIETHDSDTWRREGNQIMRIAHMIYGVYNLYTGDGWDKTEGRPSPQTSEVSLYSNPEGFQDAAAMRRRDRETQRIWERGETPPDWFANFLAAHSNVITPETWPEYEAEGLVPINGLVEFFRARHIHYSPWILYTGCAWDERTRQLLPDDPSGMYTDVEGLQHMAEMRRKHAEWERRFRAESGGGAVEPTA